MWRSIWAALSPSGRRFSAHGPALALALLCTAASAANADIPGEPLLLAVSINGVDSGAVVAALPLADGGLAVAERDLRA